MGSRPYLVKLSRVVGWSKRVARRIPLTNGENGAATRVVSRFQNVQGVCDRDSLFGG